MTDKPVTGTDVLRAKIIASQKLGRLNGFAMEVGIATNQLEGFLAGRTVPSPTILQAMAKYFWPHSRYDAERDLLIAGNTDKGKPLGATHHDLTAIIAQYGPSPQPYEFRGFRSALPETHPKPTARAGWAATVGGWLK